MMLDHKVIVIGSAHFDLIARPNKAHDITKDKIGQIVIEAGGAGYNMACDLAWLGVNTTFVSALRKSPFSDILLSKLYSLGAEVECRFIEGLPIGGFCAHLTTDGELATAISESPLDYASAMSPDAAGKIEQGSLVIADCNLGTADLSKIALQCSVQGIPLLVAGVSESKTLRVNGLEHLLTCLFFNHKEFEWYVKNSPVLRGYDPEGKLDFRQEDVATIDIDGLSYYLHDIASLVGCNLIITDGAGGAWVSSVSSSIKIPAPPLDGVVNYLGMGDLLLALTASKLLRYSEIGYRELKLAVQESIPELGEVSQNRHCNLGNRVHLEEEMDKVAKLTSTDPLTGLLNRRGLDKELNTASSKALLRRGKVALLALDIDHFKRINDTYGHGVGDQVLASVALLLKEETRGSDMLARMGGEEFLIVLPDEQLESAVEIADRIRLTIAGNLIECIEGDQAVPVKVTVSVGVTQAESFEKLTDALERADKALYQSKTEGRNRVTVRSSSRRIHNSAELSQ